MNTVVVLIGRTFFSHTRNTFRASDWLYLISLHSRAETRRYEISPQAFARDRIFSIIETSFILDLAWWTRLLFEFVVYWGLLFFKKGFLSVL